MLAGDARVRTLNARYRGKDKPTDVLSFPGRGRLGRPGRHRDQRARRPRGTRAASGARWPQELDVLALHGFLHVLGYDHETDDGTMDRLERRLRQRLLAADRCLQLRGRSVAPGRALASCRSLAAVEAAFYLVKRRRLGHLALHEPAGGAGEPLPRRSAHPAHARAHGHLHRARGHDRGHHRRCSSNLLAAVGDGGGLPRHGPLPAAVPPELPYALVRRNPERSLLLLLPVFHVYARALAPLVASCASAPRRRRPRRAKTERHADPAVPEVPPRARARRGRGPAGRRRARASRMTQVRDVMTPRPDIVAIPADGHRRRPAPRDARDEVQPRPGLRREPRRHRGRGRRARPGGVRGRAGGAAAAAGAPGLPGAGDEEGRRAAEGVPGAAAPPSRW